MLKYFLTLFCTVLLYGEAYTHFVILGDPHLPGKNITHKEKVLHTINSWDDVDAVIAMGDLCEWLGNPQEYAFVKTYFEALKKPLLPIVGNHDYLYADASTENEKLPKGTPQLQQEKLETFRQMFGLQKLYYSFIKDGYFLVFLSADSPKHLAQIGEKQLLWLSGELEKNRHLPTIIFFHAPLDKTLADYKHFVNTPSFIAQPADKIQHLIAQNPQIFIWVSGHTHTSPKEESFASPINIYEKQVTNIHNTDMNKDTIWTNSLFLYHDKVVVKTYNHNEHEWINSLERVIFPPTLSLKR